MSSAKIRQRSARKANRVRWNRYRAQRKLDGWTPIKERERLAEMNRTRVRNLDHVRRPRNGRKSHEA